MSALETRLACMPCTDLCSHQVFYDLWKQMASKGGRQDVFGGCDPGNSCADQHE